MFIELFSGLIILSLFLFEEKFVLISNYTLTLSMIVTTLLGYIIQLWVLYLMSVYIMNSLSSKKSTFISLFKSFKNFHKYFFSVSLIFIPYIILIVAITFISAKTQYIQDAINSDSTGSLILIPIAYSIFFILWFFFIPIIYFVTVVNISENKQYFISIKKAFVFYKNKWVTLWIYSWIFLILLSIFSYIPLFWWFFGILFSLSTFCYMYHTMQIE